MAVPKTSDHIQIKIKMANPIPEPSASTKVHNQDLKKIDVLSHSKSRQRAKIWIIGVSKTGIHHPNQDQDDKPQSGASSVIQRPK